MCHLYDRLRAFVEESTGEIVRPASYRWELEAGSTRGQAQVRVEDVEGWYVVTGLLDDAIAAAGGTWRLDVEGEAYTEGAVRADGLAVDVSADAPTDAQLEWPAPLFLAPRATLLLEAALDSGNIASGADGLVVGFHCSAEAAALVRQEAGRLWAIPMIVETTASVLDKTVRYEAKEDLVIHTYRRHGGGAVTDFRIHLADMPLLPKRLTDTALLPDAHHKHGAQLHYPMARGQTIEARKQATGALTTRLTFLAVRA